MRPEHVMPMKDKMHTCSEIIFLEYPINSTVYFFSSFFLLFILEPFTFIAVNLFKGDARYRRGNSRSQ